MLCPVSLSISHHFEFVKSKTLHILQCRLITHRFHRLCVDGQHHETVDIGVEYHLIQEIKKTIYMLVVSVMENKHCWQVAKYNMMLVTSTLTEHVKYNNA